MWERWCEGGGCDTEGEWGSCEGCGKWELLNTVREEKTVKQGEDLVYNV